MQLRDTCSGFWEVGRGMVPSEWGPLRRLVGQVGWDACDWGVVPSWGVWGAFVFPVEQVPSSGAACTSVRVQVGPVGSRAGLREERLGG